MAQSTLSIAMVRGERIEPECHHTRADVKAVTLHHFSLQKNPSGWQARGIQDICHPGQECIIGLMIVFVTDEIRKGFERSRSRGRSTSRAMSRQWRENARRSRGIASQLTTGYKGAAPRSGTGEFVFVILPAHRAGFPARMEPNINA